MPTVIKFWKSEPREKEIVYVYKTRVSTLKSEKGTKCWMHFNSLCLIYFYSINWTCSLLLKKITIFSSCFCSLCSTLVQVKQSSQTDKQYVKNKHMCRATNRAFPAAAKKPASPLLPIGYQLLQSGPYRGSTPVIGSPATLINPFCSLSDSPCCWLPLLSYPAGFQLFWGGGQHWDQLQHLEPLHSPSLSKIPLPLLPGAPWVPLPQHCWLTSFTQRALFINSIQFFLF